MLDGRIPLCISGEHFGFVDGLGLRCVFFALRFQPLQLLQPTTGLLQLLRDGLGAQVGGLEVACGHGQGQVSWSWWFLVVINRRLVMIDSRCKCRELHGGCGHVVHDGGGLEILVIGVVQQP